MILAEQKIDLKSRLKNIQKFIGNTPLFPIERVYQKRGVKIFAKLEWQQLGNSVKARPAFNIIKQAILNGELHEGKELLDATSGNTGIAYAAVGAALGIPVTLCLPENASYERKTILKAHGVNIIYTSPFEGTDGAQIKAKELYAAEPDKYFYADQYANPNNWKAHYNSTGEEVFQQTDGEITHFVAGLGTSGTFMGTGKRLKELNKNIELVSLQPDAPMHGLEGWKHMETAIVPKIYSNSFADRNLPIDTFEAFELIKEIAQKEGLLVSPSAAANLIGAIKVAEEIEEGVIVTVFPDDAAKYSEVINELYK
ncbi:MAG: cysteine synthase family protein [Flammeovirgaceae bacterium]|nr:cysteine synthase family protein [Flammeovirgaceae bacterium]